MSDRGESLFNFEIVDRVVLTKYLFEQRPQFRQVPLPIAETVNEFIFCFFRENFEGLIETSIRRFDYQVLVKNDKRLSKLPGSLRRS